MWPISATVLPGRELEVDLLEHGPVGGVAERDALEADLAGAGRELAGTGPVVDALGLVHHLEDPLARRGRALRLADPHAEAAQRHDQHREQEVEDEELVEAERAVHDHPAGGEEDGALREQRQEREQRHVERALPERADGLLEDGAGRALELRLAAILLRERLDDVDADDRLLGHGRDVAELLLHLAQDGVRDVAVAVGDRDDHRRDRERDQRQPPLDDEEHGHHRDDGEHVLEEEDQAEAEEEADRLQVDGRPRHQLAGLVAVVEAEREPQQVRVQPLAHVLLDPERLPAGDDPAAEHQRRLDDAGPRSRRRSRRAPRCRAAPRSPRSPRRRGGRSRSPPPARGRRGSSRRAATSGTAAGSRAGGRTCGGRGRRSLVRMYPRQLAPHVDESLAEPGAVRRVVEPAARAGGMRQRDHDRVAAREALADRARSASPSPSSRFSASPPTVTIRSGRSSSSSQSRQNSQRSCSRGVGVRSPRPEAGRPG